MGHLAILASVTLSILPAAPAPTELIDHAVAELIKVQEDGGQWPYEGVYRVDGDIPIGYRVGGTAIVADALLCAAPADDAAAAKAINRALAFVLNGLNHPLMRPSTKDRYDVRVWGHAYALEFLCRIRAGDRAGEKAKQVESWIPRLVEALLTEEIPGGGWNYAGRRAQATFVTAPVTQALLLARSQGEQVPAAVLQRAAKVLRQGHRANGAFVYSAAPEVAVEKDGREDDTAESRPAASQPAGGDPRAKLPGSIARNPVCETTLLLLGSGSVDAVQASLDAFHRHWDELEKRRAKSGTHAGPYGIAPYYFYYGHRYAAQAIELLPAETREKARQRLLVLVLRTRDKDGTWNDREFKRSRNFGTAMVVLALLGEKTPMPPKWSE